MFNVQYKSVSVRKDLKKDSYSCRYLSTKYGIFSYSINKPEKCRDVRGKKIGSIIEPRIIILA
jgi:hypothetical protein